MPATHEISFAKKVADWVVFLARGRVEESCSAAHFFEQPASPLAREYLQGLSSIDECKTPPVSRRRLKGDAGLRLSEGELLRDFGDRLENARGDLVRIALAIFWTTVF